MIESRFWRQEIRNEIKWLRRNQRYNRWSEKKMVLYERRLMLVAFQIRSLLERPKVSKAYAKRSLAVTRYNKISNNPFTWVDSDIPEYFDVEQPHHEILVAPTICNQLIHHYVMLAQSRKTGCFTTLVFTSDFKRNECLFEIEISALIAFFELFSTEESASARAGKQTASVWNEKRQDYDYVEVISSRNY